MGLVAYFLIGTALTCWQARSHPREFFAASEDAPGLQVLTIVGMVAAWPAIFALWCVLWAVKIVRA